MNRERFYTVSPKGETVAREEALSRAYRAATMADFDDEPKLTRAEHNQRMLAVAVASIADLTERIAMKQRDLKQLRRILASEKRLAVACAKRLGRV